MENDASIKISIVIPVKNGANTLPSCLKSIKLQSLYSQAEVIIIDSESVDNSIQVAEALIPEIRIISIKSSDFNHGLTRNLGVKHAKGEFVVMTVQDAWAADDQWLEKMVRHFEDTEVAGVCGQQIVPHHKDKNPHQWFRPVNPPGVRVVQYKNVKDFEMLSPEQKKKECSWDDVNAIYRKEVLLKIPFREIAFAEDALWAKEALEAGYKLVYDTAARVYHYHFQTPEYTYKRTLTQLYYYFKIFGWKRENTIKPTDYLKVVYRNFRYRMDLQWVSHNFQYLKAMNKAFMDFHRVLNQGELALDKFYFKTCQIPPQGIALKTKNQVLSEFKNVE
jgi:rhamnosyltransferase